MKKINNAVGTVVNTGKDRDGKQGNKKIIITKNKTHPFSLPVGFNGFETPMRGRMVGVAVDALFSVDVSEPTPEINKLRGIVTPRCSNFSIKVGINPIA